MLSNQSWKNVFVFDKTYLSKYDIACFVRSVWVGFYHVKEVPSQLKHACYFEYVVFLNRL